MMGDHEFEEGKYKYKYKYKYKEIPMQICQVDSMMGARQCVKSRCMEQSCEM